MLPTMESGLELQTYREKLNVRDHMSILFDQPSYCNECSASNEMLHSSQCYRGRFVYYELPSAFFVLKSAVTFNQWREGVGGVSATVIYWTSISECATNINLVLKGNYGSIQFKELPRTLIKIKG